MINKNSQLSTLIENMEQALQEATTQEQVHAVAKMAADFGEPIVYDNASYYFTALALFAAVGIGYISTASPWYFLLAIPCIIVIALPLTRSSNIKKLMNAIYLQDAMLDNGLTKGVAPTVNDAIRSFSEFSRGNHTRYFTCYYNGSYSGRDHSFDFDAYCYHYVDKKRVTYPVRDRNGKIAFKTRTDFTHHDRYGIIVPGFVFIRNLQVLDYGVPEHYKHRYKPSSIAFNKLFKVYAEDEMEAARVLKPSVVIAFEELGRHMYGLNIDFNKHGELCLSFSDSDMLKAQPSVSVENPVCFYETLLKHTDFHKMNASLEFIHELMRHTDSNFKNTKEQ